MKHIALFSQTGSEIADLIEQGIIPTNIFFDQKDIAKSDSRINTSEIGFRILKKDVKNVYR